MEILTTKIPADEELKLLGEEDEDGEGNDGFIENPDEEEKEDLWGPEGPSYDPGEEPEEEEEEEDESEGGRF